MVKSLVGCVFSRWTVVARGPNRGTASQWHCKCLCGTERLVLGATLRNGESRSCGCYMREVASTSFRKHGHCKKGARSKEHRMWSGMHQRCNKPVGQWAHLYHGKGITVCARWTGPDGFVNFLADMGPIPAGHTLDRIDSNGGYSPENCRWATPTIQSRNTSRNRQLTYDGRTQCLAAWAEERGIPRKTLTARLVYGWPLGQALEFQMRKGKNIKHRNPLS